MDQAVFKALTRWPNVPAVYGWLKLDARGNWLLRAPATGHFSVVGNRALSGFIARNYAADERGAWYFQNGPQRVYVQLERAPLVFRLDREGLRDQCGQPSGSLRGAWVDERGALYLAGERALGVLDDRDLAAAWAAMVDPHGAPLGDRLAALLEGDRSISALLEVAGDRVGLERIDSGAIESRFGFVLDPREGT